MKLKNLPMTLFSCSNLLKLIYLLSRTVILNQLVERLHFICHILPCLPCNRRTTCTCTCNPVRNKVLGRLFQVS